MRFLLDVHIATRIARALIANGHDVIHAGRHFPLATDAELLDIACAERRVLVTEDRDFSDLIFVGGRQAPEGLIYLRCEPQDQLGMVEQVVGIEPERMIHHLVVVRRTSVRFRPLPQASENNG